MVGVKKEKIKARSLKKTFVFKKFQLLGEGLDDVIYASSSKNCACFDGVLQGGVSYENAFEKEYGHDLYYSSNMIMQAGYLEGKLNKNENRTIILLQANNKIALLNFNTYKFVDVYAFKENVKMLQFTDKNLDVHTLFYGEKGVYEFKMEDGPVLKDEGVVKGACVLLDRVFYGYQGGKIVFTAPGEVFKDKNTTDDSGELYLGTSKGEIIEMVALENSIYIFFERGIMRLKVSGSARDFVLENIYYDGKIILPNFIVVKSDEIYFSSENNRYCLRANKAQLLKDLYKAPFAYSRIRKVIAFQGCFIVYVDDAANQQNAYFVIQEDGQIYEVFKLNGLGLLEKRVCVSRSGIMFNLCLGDGEILSGESYWFTSKWIDFGTSEKKMIKELTFKGEGRVTVTLRFEGGEHTYELDLSSGVASVKPLIKARNVQFHFVLSKKTKEGLKF